MAICVAFFPYTVFVGLSQVDLFTYIKVQEDISHILDVHWG